MPHHISLIRQDMPRAQVAHICLSCLQSIPPGMYYLKYIVRDNEAIDRRRALLTLRTHIHPQDCEEANSHDTD